MNLRRPRLLALIGAACLALAACGDMDGPVPFTDPPPLPTAGATWLNVEKPPTIAALKGQVVLVEFGWIHCPPCRAMMPNLIRWDAQYAPKGLKIVYVYDAAGSGLDEVREHVAALKLSYAIMHDSTGEGSRAYGVSSYPSAFLIDRGGKVIWAGNPLVDPSGVERKIAKALGA